MNVLLSENCHSVGNLLFLWCSRACKSAKQWCESTLLRRFAQRTLRAVSKEFRRFQRKSGHFSKNLAFEESSSHWNTLYAKHSLIYFFFLLKNALTFFQDPNFVRPIGSPKIFFVSKKIMFSTNSIQGLGIQN